jgi:hypothetical protein
VRAKTVAELGSRLNAMMGRPQPEGRPGALGEFPADRAVVPRIPIPISNSILWRPSGGPPAPLATDFPLFLARAALGAIHDQWDGAAGGDVLGFLIGNLVACPETAVRYVVLHTAVAVPERLENDDSLRLVAQTWPAVQHMARRGGSEVLGWYHSHAAHGIGLTPRDVATHLARFSDPWQAALVLAPGDDSPAGGLFRVTESDDWPVCCQPFYELPGPELAGAGTRAPSVLRWSNYDAEEQALGPRAVAAPPPPGPRIATAVRVEAPAVSADEPIGPPVGAALIRPPDLLLPEAFDAAVVPERPRNRLWPAARRGVMGIGLIAAAYGAWWYVGTAQAEADPGAPEAARLPATSRLAGIADSVDQAVRAYRTREQLFENRQMTCADLSTGLLTLDERWIRYSIARGATVQGPDSLRESTLTANVVSAERHFDRSGCPRP